MSLSSKPSGLEIIYRVSVAICIAATVVCFLTIPIGGIWSVLFCALFGFSFELLFFPRWQKLSQRRRDDDASLIFEAIKSSDEQYFAVFLRPFDITGKIRKERTQFTGRIYPYTYGYGFDTKVHEVYEMEEIIVKAFRDIMPVIALRKPGGCNEYYGVGKLSADKDTWKGIVSELLDTASLILCIPSGFRGTAWELDKIVERGYIVKTIFIMPPDTRGNIEIKEYLYDLFCSLVRLRLNDLFQISIHDYRAHCVFLETQDGNRWTLPEDWKLVAANMKRYEIPVPPYRRIGGLFVLKPDGRCLMEPLKLASPRRLRNALLRLRDTKRRG